MAWALAVRCIVISGKYVATAAEHRQLLILAWKTDVEQGVPSCTVVRCPHRWLLHVQSISATLPLCYWGTLWTSHCWQWRTKSVINFSFFFLRMTRVNYFEGISVKGPTYANTWMCVWMYLCEGSIEKTCNISIIWFAVFFTFIISCYGGYTWRQLWYISDFAAPSFQLLARMLCY